MGHKFKQQIVGGHQAWVCEECSYRVVEYPHPMVPEKGAITAHNICFVDTGLKPEAVANLPMCFTRVYHPG